MVDLIIRRGEYRCTGRFFYLAWNDARNHVRNEQTFLEYLVPTAVEKIWETPSLGKKRGVKDGVVTVRYVGKYVDGSARARTPTRGRLCVRMRGKQASARVEF